MLKMNIAYKLGKAIFIEYYDKMFKIYYKFPNHFYKDVYWC